MRSRMMALAVGIACVSFFPSLPSLALTVCCLLFALLGLCYYRSYAYSCLACLVVGLTYAVFWGHLLLASLLPVSWESKPISLVGEVTSLPEHYQRYGQRVQRFEFEVMTVDCNQQSGCPTRLRKLRLTDYGDKDFKPGQVWRLTAKLKRPHGFSNPAGFDYQTWLVQRGISAVGYVASKSQPQKLGETAWQLDKWRLQFKQWLERSLDSTQNKNLILALLLADRSGLSSKDWQLFAETGTSHLMVISGLHIGLVAGFVFWCGRLLAIIARSNYPERWAAVIAILAASAYAALAGFSLPTQRALVMVLIVMLAIVLQRQLQVGHSLLLALLICLVFDPLAPATASFWLSFIAVAVILFSQVGRLPQPARWKQAIKVQWVVFVGLLPVLGQWLGQISLVAPLCNLIAVPAFGLVVIPALFLAVLLTFLQMHLAIYLWRWLDGLLSAFLDGLEMVVEQLTLTSFPMVEASFLSLLLATLGILMLLMPKGGPLRLMGILMLLPLLFGRTKMIEQGNLQLTVLDVGQGLSVLVETAQHQLVYDLGPVFSQDFSAVGAVLLPTLRAKGIDQLERVVISHRDTDHSGDWRLLFDQMPVEQWDTGDLEFLPSLLQANYCQQGKNWQWDDVLFEYLYPLDRNDLADDKSNNDSCVLRITAGDQQFLLTGDIERSVELELVRRYGGSLESEVLIAPHHGSLTSSSWPFVRAVRPQHVVYTAGYRNRFGHPKTMVIERYQLQNSQGHRTDQQGAIVFRVKKGMLQPVIHFRGQRRRYWH